MDTVSAKKVVRVIPASTADAKATKKGYQQLRVAAYCRVSTKMDEQLNSYEVQKRHYTERINSEPGWVLVGIFADKGITGTSVKKRDEFNRLMRLCKQGKVDMIITKSIARFARNTVDCLTYTRMLKEHGVDVYFEEQGIHSTEPGAEFYITIYGSIAQSESENISANVKWGKAQSAREGKVSFHYAGFLGYRKGPDGNPEIDPDEAEIVRFIYQRFLAGDSFDGIRKRLEERKIPSPKGKERWSCSTIKSILSNEKYKGDAIINKTYIESCLTKKVKVNNGEREMFYVENNHEGIIDAATFGRVQEELKRRAGKQRVKQVGTKTQQGKYSSKYALSDLLVCGECKTPYRRCTWTASGKKKIVWRCISRLDYGKKYCHNSPSIEESILQDAIMEAIFRAAKENRDVLGILKQHIGLVLGSNQDEDTTLSLEFRKAEIEAAVKEMFQQVSVANADMFDESRLAELLSEKADVERQLLQQRERQEVNRNSQSRLETIFTVLDGLQNHPITYDDQIVRQLLQCVLVESKNSIRVVFAGGYEVVQALNQ